MPTTDGTREQLFLVHLWVDDIDCGVWDKWDGGKPGTENTQYRSGGQPDNENLGGGRTYSTLTISRNYRLARDAPFVGLLLAAAGNNVIAKAVKTPLDRKYNAVASGQVTAIGVVTGFDDPNSDSNSNNPAMMAVIIEPNSVTGS